MSSRMKPTGSVITGRICGKLCGDCRQIAAKCRRLCGFERNEPKRSTLANVNEYLTLRALERFHCNLLQKFGCGLDNLAIFHIGR